MGTLQPQVQRARQQYIVRSVLQTTPQQAAAPNHAKNLSRADSYEKRPRCDYLSNFVHLNFSRLMESLRCVRFLCHFSFTSTYITDSICVSWNMRRAKQSPPIQ